MAINLQTLQRILREKRLDGFIVTNPVNIFYLTNFKGISQTERESILIFNPKATLITARLYQNEALKLKSKDLAIKIVNERDELFEFARLLLKKSPKIGFESNDLKYLEYQTFKKTSPQVQFLGFEDLIEDLRAIKTDDEIKNIEKAQIISQKAFEKVIKSIKVGQTEQEIAETLGKIIKNLGGQGLAFESIIASGPNSGLPHYVTGSKKIKKGEPLLFDFGAKYNGYCADLSRTVFIGRANDIQKKMHMHVLEAQKKTIKNTKSGLKTHQIYHFANNYFKDKKLEKNFLHSLGHGIGLEVHEKPYLRSSSNLSGLIKENMIFSIEPGLYFPWGGIRTEDLVAIKNNKARVLGEVVTEIIEV